MLRILIADTHGVLRKGVRDFIRAHSGWEVCGEAADGHQALELSGRTMPDIVLAEVILPGLSGIGLTRRLREDLPSVRPIFFTMRDDRETVLAGLAAGAWGYVPKTDSADDLEAAIETVGAGRFFLSQRLVDLLLHAAEHGRNRGELEHFTTRELEVAQLLAEGNTSKTIAVKLGITPKTVEFHRAAVFRKAGVRSVPHFVSFAIRHNLIRA